MLNVGTIASRSPRNLTEVVTPRVVDTALPPPLDGLALGRSFLAFDIVVETENKNKMSEQIMKVFFVSIFP